MLSNLFREVITGTSIITDENKPSNFVMPEYRPVWDEKEGRIKIKEKKRPLFDPKMY